MTDEQILALSLKHIPPYESTDEQVVRFARALLAAIPSDSTAPTPDAERHVTNHAGDFSPLTEERKSQIAESVARRYVDACRAAVELAFAAPIASALPMDKENGK